MMLRERPEEQESKQKIKLDAAPDWHNELEQDFGSFVGDRSTKQRLQQQPLNYTVTR